MPVFFIDGTDTAHLYSAEPKQTLPLAASSFHPWDS